MVRFHEIQGRNYREILHRHSKQHLFVKNKKQKPEGEEVEDPLTGLSHFQYGNGTEQADESVDLVSNQNHMGPPGQFLTSLDSCGSIAPD